MKPDHRCAGTDERPDCVAMIDARRTRCTGCAFEQDAIMNRRRALARKSKLRETPGHVKRWLDGGRWLCSVCGCEHINRAHKCPNL